MWKRKIKKEKKADISRDAGKQRADARAQGSYLLRNCLVQRLLAAAAFPAC